MQTIHTVLPIDAERARFVSANPEHFCDDPDALSEAWIIQKMARGDGVVLCNIGDPAYRIEPTTPETQPDRITRKIRNHVERNGLMPRMPLVFRG